MNKDELKAIKDRVAQADQLQRRIDKLKEAITYLKNKTGSFCVILPFWDLYWSDKDGAPAGTRQTCIEINDTDLLKPAIKKAVIKCFEDQLYQLEIQMEKL